MSNDYEGPSPEDSADDEDILEDTNLLEHFVQVGEGIRAMAQDYSTYHKLTFEQALNVITSDRVGGVIMRQIRKKLLSEGE